MFANLMTADGKSFALEKCSGGHVWKEFDVGSFKPEYPIELELTKKSKNMMKKTQGKERRFSGRFATIK